MVSMPQKGWPTNCAPKLKFAYKHGEANQAMKRPVRGFTLLELLVVMVIIGLLASYVAPRFFDQIGKSEVKAARAQLDALDKALGAYRIDTGHYPSTQQGLGALVSKPQDEAKWSGPYLAKALPPDPWGRAYVYTDLSQRGSRGRARKDGRLNPINADFDLYSVGEDGRTTTPLTAPMSKDDVIRARDGAFLGLASDF